jgi:hypothetical protein
MTNIEKVVECIEASPRGVCNACISDTTDVRPHQQVYQICQKLVGRGLVDRIKGVCDQCGRELVINSSRMANADRATRIPVRPTPNIHAVTPATLDELRRFIIQKLNAIDPSNGREGITKRIIRLRDDERIPWNVASLALTHCAYRNRVVYDAFVIDERESQILRLIDAVLRDFFSRG